MQTSARSANAAWKLSQAKRTHLNQYFLWLLIPLSLLGDLGDTDEHVEQLCWGTTDVATNGTPSRAGKQQEDRKLPHQDDQEPLALLVVHAAMHMLFLPQFTCDYYEDTTSPAATGSAPSTGEHNNANGNSKGNKLSAKSTTDANEAKHDKEIKLQAGLPTRPTIVDGGVSLLPTPTSILWAPGVGVGAQNLGFDASTRKYDKNRIEILRLLLAACSDPLYSPADSYNPLASRWLAVATAADAPNAPCLFYSLLNTVLCYDPRGGSIGFSQSTHASLVELSCQVLCILLDCGRSGSAAPVVDQRGQPCVPVRTASQGGFNLFRTLLARLETGRDLTLMYNGMARLLKSTYESEGAYSGMGTTKLGCYQELLVLLWKTLEENPLFLPHILTRCDVTEIVVPICFLVYKSRRDPAHIGLVHICTFVLLKLSGERSFGVALNRAFQKKLPTDLPLFHGCHTDLLAITLHKLVVNGAYKLVPLYSCFLTILANISPYWKSMSLVAAVKLVNLFELFASPKFLYSGESAYKHLALLLEVFNNILQYQYHGNAHLVYAIIRRKDVFGHVAALTVEQAQTECHRVFGDESNVQRDVVVDRKGIPTIHGNEADMNVHDTPFTPTESWVQELKANLPLETVSRLLQHVVPVVDDIVANKSGVVDEQHILDVLNDLTMVGLLPVPHPIVIRKYQPNQYTALWFTAFVWGVVFLRNQDLPLFDGEFVELFQVSLEDDEDDGE